MPKWTNEQQLAIDKEGTNIIVSAGAGSGKTAVLSERVVRKLKEGVHVNELLILTFTNKAAEEMKERIRKKINDNIDIKNENNLIDSAYITTFDSFALSLVKKYHYMFNISKEISIVDSGLLTLEKNKILDNIFDYYYSINNDNFNNLIDNFCKKDDKDLRNYILNLINKLSLNINYEEYINNYLNTYYYDKIIDNYINKYINIIENKINLLKEYVEELSYYMDGETHGKYLNVFNLLFNSSSYNEYVENITIKLPIIRNLSDIVKEKKENISKKLKELKNLLSKYNSIESIKEEILSTYNNISIMLEIIKEFNIKLSEYKNKYNFYEFNDIAIMAINLVKNNDNIREELKNSFKEILLDEYQDTNDIQESFISLIANNNVYMVGDIKQSIYRFRNANPYIFKDKYDNYSNNINGFKIDLNKNFRSRREVISGINLIFNIIMDDFLGGADYIKSHQMVFGNTAYKDSDLSKLSLYSYNYDKDSIYSKEEIEAFIIAKDIKDKINNKYQVLDKDTNEMRDITYSDFSIIIDRSSSFDLYKKIFEYNKIPLSLFKDEVMNNDIDIIVLKNLIKFLIKVKDKKIDDEFKYLFVSILRSYLFEENDEIIFDYFINNNYYDSDLYKICLDIVSNIDSLSNKEIINILIDKFNIYEKIILLGNIESFNIKIDKIKDIANNLNNIGFNIYDFSNYLEDVIDEGFSINYSVNDNNSNSVKIMTIHKSKGLEYPISYFSGLYKKFNISDLTQKIIYDNKIGIIIPSFIEEEKDTILKEILRSKYIDEEISEKIRLFYVALTRAREKIILVTPTLEEKEFNTNIKIDYRSFKDILDSISNDLYPYNTNIELNDINLTKDYNKLNISNYDIKENNTIDVFELNIDNNILEDKHFSKENIKLNTKEEKDNMKLGLEFHSILEFIDFINPNYDLIDNSFLKNKIRKFLDSELLKNIKDSKIYKEYEFVYKENNIKYHGIIDLMIEYDDHIDIIDYKLSNIEDNNYISQLEGYKNYIKSISDKDVNIYLYSILNNSFKKL